MLVTVLACFMTVESMGTTVVELTTSVEVVISVLVITRPSHFSVEVSVKVASLHERSEPGVPTVLVTVKLSLTVTVTADGVHRVPLWPTSTVCVVVSVMVTTPGE